MKSVSTMSYYFSKFGLWLLGWKISSDFQTEQVRKCIFIVAPHTSFWDFIIGRMAFWSLRMDTKFLIKKSFFAGILGPPLKGLGGVPVDRSKGANTIKQTIGFFKDHDDFYLLITPEGTRKYTNNWKKGFYQIAREAQVPVYMCFLDYKKKRGGIANEFIITGNYEQDFKQIEEFYCTMWAKYPEHFNLSPKQ